MRKLSSLIWLKLALARITQQAPVGEPAAAIGLRMRPSVAASVMVS